MILNGTETAGKIYTSLKKDISLLQNKPTLWAILVWNSSASLRYIRQKRKFAEKIGMNFNLLQLPEEISEATLIAQIQDYNQSAHISGYIVQLPLPKHINENTVINSITPTKDVDGFHPKNQGKIMIGDTSGFAPCTPAGVMRLFQEYDISLSGKRVCIIGRSNIVGKPLAMMCINKWATVISCNSRTPSLEEFTKNADIIICATGMPHLLTPNMTKSDSVIIDVGFSVINKKIKWDADTQAFIDAGNTITPVPGWVGPMTVAMLMNNTYLAHIKNNEV